MSSEQILSWPKTADVSDYKRRRATGKGHEGDAATGVVTAMVLGAMAWAVIGTVVAHFI